MLELRTPRYRRSFRCSPMGDAFGLWTGTLFLVCMCGDLIFAARRGGQNLLPGARKNIIRYQSSVEQSPLRGILKWRHVQGIRACRHGLPRMDIIHTHAIHFERCNCSSVLINVLMYMSNNIIRDQEVLRADECWGFVPSARGDAVFPILGRHTRHVSARCAHAYPRVTLVCCRYRRRY